MSSESSRIVELADVVSELLYTIAGGLLIGLGTLGIVATTLRVTRESVPSDPVPSAVIVIFSLLFLILGIFVTPQFRRRINRRQPLAQFGPTRSVDTRVLRPEEGVMDECVVCGSQSNQGLIRRYRREFCVAGIPVLTTAEGDNFYCVECASMDGEKIQRSDEKTAETERN